MDFAGIIIAGLALLGTTYAFPIGTGILGGISLAPNPLNSFYNQEVVIGNLPLRYGFGVQKDGTIRAGFRVVSQLNGKELPFTAAVSGNYKDIKKTFKFEIGTRLLDKLSAVIQGDKEGLRWMSTLWVPVNAQGGLNSIGASLEGDKLKPVAFSGGFGYLDKVYQARLELDKNMMPAQTDIVIDAGAKLKNIAMRKF